MILCINLALQSWEQWFSLCPLLFCGSKNIFWHFSLFSILSWWSGKCKASHMENRKVAVLIYPFGKEVMTYTGFVFKLNIWPTNVIWFTHLIVPCWGGVKSNSVAKKEVRDQEASSLIKCKCQMEKKAANLIPMVPWLYI